MGRAHQAGSQRDLKWGVGGSMVGERSPMEWNGRDR